MTEIALELDQRANDSLKALMSHYRIENRAELFSKAIAVLKIVAHIENTNGELFARRGMKETKIIVR